MSTVSLRNRRRGRSASSGAIRLMMRSAADFEIPNSGASWRSVKSVRQYAATSRTRSSRGGRAPRPASADRVRSLAAQGGHQLAEAARAQPGERACPGRL
jgi:hypothetical protein